MSALWANYRMIGGKVDKLADKMDKKFQGVDDKMDTKFQGVDDKFIKVDDRFNKLEQGIQHNVNKREKS